MRIVLGILSALAGAVAGTVAGIFLFARSAPSGEGARFAGSAFLGLVALAGLVGLGVWGWASLREIPPSGWLDVEVRTSQTRPAGTVISSEVREEGDYLVVPVVQRPLIRSSSRVIAVRVAGTRVELFTPPMKATPDPRAGWSGWYRPQRVEPPPEAEAAGEPLRPILEVRYLVRRYGE